jgi:RecJ-like exonuclease
MEQVEKKALDLPIVIIVKVLEKLEDNKVFLLLLHPCPKCHGSGQMISDPCHKCHGDGRMKKM